MLDNHDNRNLSDVFKELQEMQQAQTTSAKKHPKIPKVKKHFAFRPKQSTSYQKCYDLKLSHIIVGCGILIVGLAVFFPKNTSFTQSYAKEETLEEISEYELNRHRLNMQSIISENAEMDRVKEQVTEERDVEFITEYTNNPTLPKSEEIVKQEGAFGKENVTAIKTYENGNFVEEIILEKEKLVDPISKIIDIGTSEFLAKHKVHLGDTMYLVNTAKLKKTDNDNADEVAEVKQSLDVKLLELPSEEWCKVSFDNIEGFIKTSNLTSAYTTPNIAEKNRVQKILIKVNIDMELNRTSGLTLNDYKKIFSNLPNDKKKILEYIDNILCKYDEKTLRTYRTTLPHL